MPLSATHAILQIERLLHPPNDPGREWSGADDLMAIDAIVKAVHTDGRYVRMVIGQALSDEQLQEFSRIYRMDLMLDFERHAGFASASFLLEEGGTLAISITTWRTREACLSYHSSRSYRTFVHKTQHLLAGNFVVKMFEQIL